MTIWANSGAVFNYGQASGLPARPKVCTRCNLHNNCTTNCVPPRGSSTPIYMLVGEAPGPDEDKQGVPFVGRSGQLLDKMLATAKINPASCRWTNTVRCFPKQPDNSIGKPSTEEIKTCTTAHLLLEIAQTKPQLIVALGKIAATALTGKRSSLDELRGYTHKFSFPNDFITWAESQGIIVYEAIPEKTGGLPPQQFDPKTCRSITYPVVCTYHPAFALRQKNQASQGIIESDLDYCRRKAMGEARLPGVDYRVIQSISELEQWRDYLIAGYRAGTIPFLSYDLETSGDDDEGGLREFDPTSEIVTIQIAYAEKHAILIPVSHPEGNFANAFGMAAIRQTLHRLFVEEKIPLVGQNIGFDYKFTYAKFGIKLDTVVFDTKLAHQCLYAGDLPNDLDFLSSQYVGMQGYTDGLKEALDALPKGKRTFINLRLDQAYIDYACGDVDAVFRLVPVLTKMLHDKSLWYTYQHCYIQAFVPMVEMEINGLPIDLSIYEWLKWDMPTRLTEIIKPVLESKFYPAYLQYIGCPVEHIPLVVSGNAPPKIQKDYQFNPGSSQQKVKLLFDVMGFPRPAPTDKERLTDGGEPSTDKAALAELRDTCSANGWADHLAVVEAVQEYAVLAKLHSAYILNLPDVVPDRGQPAKDLYAPYIPKDLVTWSCHPQYKQDGTQTGRLSVGHPAIHNMPQKSAVKRLFRSRWRDQGGFHLQFDYSAMEVRILACSAMANDPTLKQAFAQGFDAHKYVASIIFGKPIDQVTPEERKICKTVNFAVLYGAGPENVAGVAGVSVTKAEKFIADYLGALPHVARWKLGQERFALSNGYVKSAFDRIRYLSPRVYSKGDIERRAVNTPIQSTASDVTLTSYIRIYHKLREYGFRSLPYLFVHDSLGFDVYPGEYFELWELLQYEMAVVPPQLYPWLDVPLAVDSDAGFSWGVMSGVERLDRNDWKFTSKDPANSAALVSQLQRCGHPIRWTIQEEIADGKPISAWYINTSRRLAV